MHHRAISRASRDLPSALVSFSFPHSFLHSQSLSSRCGSSSCLCLDLPNGVRRGCRISDGGRLCVRFFSQLGKPSSNETVSPSIPSSLPCTTGTAATAPASFTFSSTKEEEINARTSSSSLNHHKAGEREREGKGGKMNTSFTSSSNNNNNPTNSSEEEKEDHQLQQKEMLKSIFLSLRLELKSRQPIGSVFRLLSKEQQKALAQLKIPVEVFLLHFPQHFCVFRSKIARNTGMIQVCPVYQAPSTVRPLVLPESGRVPLLWGIAGEEGGGGTGVGHGNTFGEERRKMMMAGGGQGGQQQRHPHPSAPPSPGDGLRDDLPLSRKQQLQYILSNIPDNFISFVDLRIPQKVKEEYMGYPSIKPKEFFLRHHYLFEVRDGEGPHTFYVRRKTSLVP